MTSRASLIRYKLLQMVSRRRTAVIYTVLTGAYEPLKSPIFIDPKYDYVAFVDAETPHTPAPWQRREITRHERNSRVTSRYYKMHPHILFPEYTLSIYVDASLLIISDFAPLLEMALRDHDIALYRHRERDCIYEEAKCVVMWNLDSAEVIECQTKRYRDMGYPEHNGMFEAGVIIRRHHVPLVAKTMEAWWQEVKNFSQRDQVSGNVMFWQNGLAYYEIQGSVFSNEYVERDIALRQKP